jgi:hypothetical protein
MGDSTGLLVAVPIICRQQDNRLEPRPASERRRLEGEADGQGANPLLRSPLELNGNLQHVADVYSYALKVACVAPVYSTAMKDAGIPICPTRYPSATLYVITSESKWNRCFV